MSSATKRVEKLEAGLTPKQAILLWFQEAHAFNSIEEYVHHLKGQPDNAAPIDRLTTQVAAALSGCCDDCLSMTWHDNDVIAVVWQAAAYCKVDSCKWGAWILSVVTFSGS